MAAFDPKGLVEARTELEAVPEDLNNVLLVGTPNEIPESAVFWERAGFIFEGNKVTHLGKTISLDEGAAVAIVEFAPGKYLGLRCGTSKYEPNTGIASTALVDKMGRFLTGKTVPRLSAPLVLSL